MASPRSLDLYKQVVEITNDYLGPASERFITRQIENHLKKQPESLQKKDLQSLIVWISLAMNLLIDDKKIVDEYITSLQLVAESK